MTYAFGPRKFAAPPLPAVSFSGTSKRILPVLTKREPGVRVGAGEAGSLRLRASFQRGSAGSWPGERGFARRPTELPTGETRLPLSPSHPVLGERGFPTVSVLPHPPSAALSLGETRFPE